MLQVSIENTQFKIDRNASLFNVLISFVDILWSDNMYKHSCCMFTELFSFFFLVTSLKSKQDL